MSSVFSEHWHRVASLRPQLRRHARLSRHVYRGELSYLLRDEVSGQFHRFNANAYQLIGMLDGRRTLDDIWRQLGECLGDDMPGQDEVIDLLGRLHRANVLNTEVPPDIPALARRRQAVGQQKDLKQWSSLLGVRIPLHDPSRWLPAAGGLARLLFSRTSLALFLLALLAGLLLAGTHWSALTGNLRDSLLAPSGVAMILLVYPFIKLVHELAHTLAVRRFGGTVHEMGVMLLVFIPIPYVDASEAYTFPQKWQRMLVGAAGILAELWLAAVALVVWTLVEPGIVRGIAYYVVITCGISSLFFNGNPLLRFDAYYVLADWLEMPNMAQRAGRYLGFLLRRHVLHFTELADPTRDRREAMWLAGYGTASFLYRMVMLVGISLFVVESYLFIGVVIMTWSLLMTLLLPLARNLRQLLREPDAKRHRARVLLTFGSMAAMALLLVGALPLPLASYTQGVGWVAETDRLRAGADGFIAGKLVASGSRVEKGDSLLSLENPLLPAQLRLAEARLGEARSRHAASAGLVSAQLVQQEEIRRLELALADIRQRQRDLNLRAPAAGNVVWVDALRMPGRYLQRGELVGYIHAPQRMAVRLTLHENQIDLARAPDTKVSIRLASRPGLEHAARIVAIAPEGDVRLPSAALTEQGGGRIPHDPEKTPAFDGRPSASTEVAAVAVETHFLIDLEVPGLEFPLIGERVHVLFEHPSEPLYSRWLRSLRRLFLSRFDW